MKLLAAQIAIVSACIFAITQQAWNFPAPSPLIKPFLPVELRWPVNQIKQWAETGGHDEAFLAFFARDPERTIPPGDNVVSPADGTVQGIYEDGDKIQFAVGLSFWDVHVVRTPVAGVVKSVEGDGERPFIIKNGVELITREQVAYLKGKEAPVQKIVTLDTDAGEITVRLITSYWARRIQIWVHPGQRLEKGERLGRILLGSTVVAELPKDIFVNANVGASVYGGESIIAVKGSKR